MTSVCVCVLVLGYLCPVQAAETVCSIRVLVAGILNHELDALHTIIVRATDGHGLFKVHKFSVTIQDVNDIPHVRNEGCCTKSQHSGSSRPGCLSTLLFCILVV